MDEATADPYLEAVARFVCIAILVGVSDCESIGVRCVSFAPDYLSARIKEIIAVHHDGAPPAVD
jgi:hypothetical protein